MLVSYIVTYVGEYNTWSMPFDYNMTRIKQQPIIVHEEMRLPKSWKGFGDLTQFNATVNGQPLSGLSLGIDPFSFPDAMVVHYLDPGYDG
jgi:hypothetical protein